MFFILTLLVIFFQLSTKYPNVTFIEQIFLYLFLVLGYLCFLNLGKRRTIDGYNTITL